MRTSILLAVGLGLLAGCGPNNPVTKPGTVLFEWDASKASRPSFKTIKIGSKTSKDFKVTIDKKAPFVVKLHVDFASVEFEEGGKTVKQTTAVAARAVVDSNDDWDLSGGCIDGPNYKMGPMSPSGEMISPPGMIQDCRIRYNRRSGLVFKSTYQLGKTLNIDGEGTVKAFTEDEVTIE